MQSPRMEDLMSHVDSRYKCVVAAAKRARQIVDERGDGLVAGHKPVTLALMELADGKIVVSPKDANKKSQ